MWTIERVKEELPKVQVKMNAKLVVTGRVTGRKLDFAGVYVGDVFMGEYAWQTIVNALNNNKPLLV